MNHVFLSTGSPAAAVATGVELVNRHLPRAPTGKLLRRQFSQSAIPSIFDWYHRTELECHHPPHAGWSLSCFCTWNLLFTEHIHDEELYCRTVTLRWAKKPLVFWHLGFQKISRFPGEQLW